MKLKTILFETLWATLFGAVLALIALFAGMTAFVVIVPMFVIVLVSVRQGGMFGFRVSLLISVVIVIGTLIKNGAVQPFDIVMYQLHGLLAIIVGFFAKNIHRNLNNKKMATVQLNVIAAQIISTLLMLGLNVMFPNSSVTLLDCLFYGISSSVLILALAHIKPKTILTVRSRYLSSKERSKLLND